METLKKIAVIIVLFVGVTQINIKAQNASAVQTAFDQSYAYENSSLYTKAADALKAVYNDKSYEMNLRMGWLLYKNGSYNEAIIYYQKAITILPTSIEAKLGYVLPQSALGNWDKVIEQYTEILKVDPQNSTTNYRMGLIYYNKGDFKTAFKFMEKATTLYPFDYDITLYFAWINLKLEKYTEAKTLFNRVLLISPNDASATEGLKLIK